MPRFSVEYGRAVIPDGFFLLRQQRPPREPRAYTDLAGDGFRHLSTFPDRSTIKESVLECLAGARRHIFFCNFLLQDEEIVQALLDAGRRLNGHVYVITTLKKEDFAAGDEDAAGDEAGDGTDFESHLNNIRRLTGQGLWVKARSDCHAKFLTVDDVQAIVTSANAVPTCYGNVSRADGRLREANPENGVWLGVTKETRRLANFFRALWRNGCNYYVAPGKEVFKVEDVTSSAVIKASEPAAPADEGEVLWTAPANYRLLDRLLRMVCGAQQTIDLATWVIKGMDTHPLGAALQDAGQRGVRLRILVRGMNWRDDHRRQCYRLARALGPQVEFLGDYWNHAKALIVDRCEALVMSANLDAQHGLDSGIEVGFSSRQPAFVDAVSAFLDRLAADAAFELIPDPTQAEMAQRYGTQRGPQPGTPLRIRLLPKDSRRVRLAQQWCAAAGKELVRLRRIERKERELLLLMTDQLALYCRRGPGPAWEAQDIRENPPPADVARFDSYLQPTAITLDI